MGCTDPRCSSLASEWIGAARGQGRAGLSLPAVQNLAEDDDVLPVSRVDPASG